MAESNVYFTLVMGKALKNLEELKKLGKAPESYTPFDNHLYGDKVIGCSRLAEGIVTVEDVVRLILAADSPVRADFDDIIDIADSLKEAGETSLDENVELQGSLVRGIGMECRRIWCPGVCVSIHLKAPCGVLSIPEPIEGETYTLKMFHGCLQPFGRITECTEETDIISVVLTLDDFGDKKALCLASIYPGLPDNDTANREGLVEGQILTAAEVCSRKLRPKEAKA